ncbi:MAG: hypothetical protein RIC55_16975 [Pirellulaceae bacterium]
MVVLGITFGTLAFVFLAHVIMWRIRLPEKPLKLLLYMFLVSITAVLVVHFKIEDSLLKRDIPHLSGLADYLAVILLYVPISLAYIIGYTTLQVDSPTLSLIWEMHRTGAAGMSSDDISRFSSERPFVRDRLDALLEQGVIVRRNDRLFAANRLLPMFRVVLFYRSLYHGHSEG